MNNESIIFVVAYFLGSIPFGLLFTKMFMGVDIREIGSGNIGATNVLRSGNKKIAALTLICDMLKALLATSLAKKLSSDPTIINGAAAISIVGHIFPIWLKLRGGKGIASFLGALLGLDWVLAIALLIVWLTTAKITKISSLSAIIAVGCFALYLSFAPHTLVNWIWFVMIGLMLIRHKDNISRLLSGKETSFAKK